VLNSVAAGRRLVLRAAAWQGLAVLLVAALFLLWGVPQALAAAVGGAAIVAGALLAAWMAFGGGVLGAVSAVLRLVAGMVVKWVVVIGVLVMGAGLYKLPPLPLLAGVITGLVAQVLVATGKQR
jgi:ATP synthase protein I